MCQNDPTDNQNDEEVTSKLPVPTPSQRETVDDLPGGIDANEQSEWDSEEEMLEEDADDELVDQVPRTDD